MTPLLDAPVVMRVGLAEGMMRDQSSYELAEELSHKIE